MSKIFTRILTLATLCLVLEGITSSVQAQLICTVLQENCYKHGCSVFKDVESKDFYFLQCEVFFEAQKDKLDVACNQTIDLAIKNKDFCE